MKSILYKYKAYNFISYLGKIDPEFLRIITLITSFEDNDFTCTDTLYVPYNIPIEETKIFLN